MPLNDPIGSTAADVHAFNVAKEDEFVNSTENFYVDRFGNPRYTAKGLATLGGGGTIAAGQFITPGDYGGVGDGVADDTTAIQNAIASGKAVAIDKTYRFTQPLTSSGYVTTVGEGMLLYDGANNDTQTSPALTLSGDSSGGIRLHSNSKSIIGVEISNPNDNFICQNIIVTGIVASDPAQNASGGVLVRGDAQIGFIYAKTFANTGHSNGSYPYVVGGLSSRLTCGNLVMEDCVSGISNSGTNVMAFGLINAKNLSDNLCYNLGGVFHAGEIVHEGAEEGIVNQGYAYVGKYTAIGAMFSPFNLQFAKYTEIGEIVCTYPKGTAAVDIPANIPNQVFYHRSGNAGYTGGVVKIGRIVGDVGILAFSTGSGGAGTTENIEIGYMDLNVHYSPSKAESTLNVIDIRACNQYTIKQGKLTIVDAEGVLTSGTTYFLGFFGSPTKMSRIEDLDVAIVDTNGAEISESFANFRGTPQSEFLKIENGRWQTNVGPYFREKRFGQSQANSFVTAAVPSGGYWHSKQRFAIESVASDSGFIVTTAGSPGTFGVYHGNLVSKVESAGRVLNTSDIGTEIQCNAATNESFVIGSSATTVAFNQARIAFLNIGSGTMTVQASVGASVSLNGVSGGAVTLAPDEGVVITRIGGNDWVAANKTAS